MNETDWTNSAEQVPWEGQSVEALLARDWPPPRWQNVSVLLAVSGGPDSIALLRAMAALKTGGRGRLAVAHLNHGLRGAESQADQAFVESLCQSLDLPCHTATATSAQLPSDQAAGLEATARSVRYEFLTETAEEFGARYVATAHTADDQAETILHRVIRGTGIAGLAGIPRTRRLTDAVTLVRPLLGIHRATLVAYLDQLNQPFRIDSTNRDTRRTRSAIRHELLPLLSERFNNQVSDALLRLGRLAGEAQQLIDDRVDECIATAVSFERSGAAVIDGGALANCPPFLVRELVKRVWAKQGWSQQAMGFAEWERLADMLSDPQAMASHALPGGIHAHRRGGTLVLNPTHTDSHPVQQPSPTT